MRIAEADKIIIVGDFADGADKIGHGSIIFHTMRKKLPDAQIIVIKVADSTELSEESLIEGLKVAINENVDLVNLSMGMTMCEDTGEMSNICNEMERRGVILVSAFDNDGGMSYPAAFYNVIGVDISARCKLLSQFEYVESECVNIKGFSGVMRMRIGNKIYSGSGTSFACAIITAEIAKEMIQGEKQSQVKLRLLRDGKVHEVTAVRQNVDTSVASSIMTINHQSVGYLRIVTFGENISENIEKILQEMKAQNVEKIIIDLRDNSGGYLNAAQEILDLFIPKGQILFSLEDKDGESEEYKATSREKYVFEQGYIFVNDQTASASEVLSAGLKENLGYLLVGETTYGKGVAQTQVTLSQSAVLKYTHEKWLTPHGTWINGTGLKPDYEVSTTSIQDFHFGEMTTSYQYDDVDDNIQYMQEMLKALGYPVERQDGYFSKQTTKALQAFEKDYHLTQDGVYSTNDRFILLSALTYHLYQEKEDAYLQKMNQLIQ